MAIKEKLKQFLTPKTRYLDKEGHELPDPTPVAPPLGYNPQPTLRDQIRDMVRSEKLRQEAELAGAETFDESNDFEVDELDEPTSSYEVDQGDLAYQMLREPALPPTDSPPKPPTPPEGAEGGSPIPVPPKQGNPA